jgi:nicotinamidase-related amidase
MRPLAVFCALIFAAVASAQDVPIKVTLRSREAVGDAFKTVTKSEAWNPKQTAIIVCDMWDHHHCPTAEKRVGEIAPRMNEVLKAARDRGVLIIHAPSECMAKYKDFPGRKLAMSAPKAADLPKDIGVWCHKIPSEEKGKYPIDQSDGGCDCAPKEQTDHDAFLEKLGRNPKAPWKAQTPLLTIADIDPISDSGVEIWNLLTNRQIENVLLLGVHTNMCVLGRPFGLRQLAKNGKHVALVRDMTDTMYNPARWPNVSHFQGTDLIVEHIEKFVCPTITSDQIAGGEPFRFKQ